MTIDHFSTPPGIATAAVQKLIQLNATLYKPRVLDPGCGSGTWGQAVRSCYPNADIFGIDIRIVPKPNGYDRVVKYDFVAWSKLDRDIYGIDPFDLIIGNPPYSQAEEFIRHAWTLTTWENGWIVFLLRLGLLGGQERGGVSPRQKSSGLWRDLPPTHISVLSARPSFTGNGVTDPAQEYGVFYWNKHPWGRGQPALKNVKTSLDWLDWKPIPRGDNQEHKVKSL